MSSKVLVIAGIVSAAVFRVHAQASLDQAVIGTAVRAVAEVFVEVKAVSASGR